NTFAPRTNKVHQPLLTCQLDRHNPDLHSFPTRRSSDLAAEHPDVHGRGHGVVVALHGVDGAGLHGTEKLARGHELVGEIQLDDQDRKSTRLNSSHVKISYAVFCLKKKNKYTVADIVKQV